MFTLERLVRYDEEPSVIFQRLKANWHDQYFEIVEADEKTGELLCTAQSYRRVRVHTKTVCLSDQNGTVVQIIYSPALTPAMSRPVSLKSYIQKAVRQDLETRIKSVLDQTGNWVTITHDQVRDAETRLEDPLTINKKARKSTAILQLFLGLVVAGIGALMSYLHFEDIFVFGSYELWMSAAIIGVIVFCIAFFRLIWPK